MQKLMVLPSSSTVQILVVHDGLFRKSASDFQTVAIRWMYSAGWRLLGVSIFRGGEYLPVFDSHLNRLIKKNYRINTDRRE